MYIASAEVIKSYNFNTLHRCSTTTRAETLAAFVAYHRGHLPAASNTHVLTHDPPSDVSGASGMSILMPIGNQANA